MFYNKVLPVLYHSALILTFAGCSESTGTRDVTGTYALVSIDARPVPTAQGSQTYDHGVLVIAASGNFVLSDFIRASTGAVFEQAYGGTWTVSGSTITLVSVAIPTLHGTVSGDVIEVPRSALFRYER